jgi:flagellar basal body rod protein FlgC
MTHMMTSSRLYQANLSVMQTARESYQQALSIGKGR